MLSLGSDMEPFSAKEDQVIHQLIKETAALKEATYRWANERWDILNREISPLRAERPTILDDVKAFCNGRINKAKMVKQKKHRHSMKQLI